MKKFFCVALLCISLFSSAQRLDLLPPAQTPVGLTGKYGIMFYETYPGSGIFQASAEKVKYTDLFAPLVYKTDSNLLYTSRYAWQRYKDSMASVIAAAINSIAALEASKVDNVAGKGLSANDYTDAEKADNAANTAAKHAHANKGVLDRTTAAYRVADSVRMAKAIEVNNEGKIDTVYLPATSLSALLKTYPDYDSTKTQYLGHSGNIFHWVDSFGTVSSSGGGSGGTGGVFTTWPYLTTGLETNANHGLLYTGGGASGFGNVGRSAEQISTGQRLIFDLAGDVGHVQRMIGITTQAAPTGWQQFSHAVYVWEDGKLYDVIGGTAGSTIRGTATGAAGEKLCLYYNAGAIKLQQSTDSGVTWTTLYTYSGSPSGSYYAGIDVNGYSGAGVKVENIEIK